MSATVTRLLSAAAWLAAAATLALPAIRSDARFNSVSTNTMVPCSANRGSSGVRQRYLSMRTGRSATKLITR